MTDPDCPPVVSLKDWHVGLTTDGKAEVRFELADNAEARAWARWFLNRGDERTEGE